jgi:hypothetical protein
MSGSIHIHGTESSVLDTVFVCRSSGAVPRRSLAANGPELTALIREDLEAVRAGGVKVTRGDALCIARGHLIRMAVWRCRPFWDPGESFDSKTRRIGAAIEAIGGMYGVASLLPEDFSEPTGLFELKERTVMYPEEWITF